MRNFSDIVDGFYQMDKTKRERIVIALGVASCVVAAAIALGSAEPVSKKRDDMTDWRFLPSELSPPPAAAPVETAPPPSPPPPPPPMLTAQDVRVSAYYSCAVNTFGILQCWGSFYTFKDDNMDKFRDIGYGAGGICGVYADDLGPGMEDLESRMRCYGPMQSGSVMPEGHDTAKYWIVRGGSYSMCALLRDETEGNTQCEKGCEAQCWGNNEYGQSTVPTGADVPAGEDMRFIDFAIGAFHTCGIKPDHSHVCWGKKMGGNFNNPTYQKKECGVVQFGDVDGIPEAEAPEWLTALVGDGFARLKLQNYEIKTPAMENWAKANNIIVKTEDVEGVNVIKILMNVGVNAVVKPNDIKDGDDLQFRITLKATATNLPEDGQTVFTYNSVGTPYACAVQGAGTAMPYKFRLPLTCGVAHCCGVVEEGDPESTVEEVGRVRCWGDNTFEVVKEENIPVDIYTMEVNELSGGLQHYCVTNNPDPDNGIDFDFYCWGWKDVVVTQEIPKRIAPGYLKDFSSGPFHMCGIRTDDKVDCWGSNSHGQVTNVPILLYPDGIEKPEGWGDDWEVSDFPQQDLSWTPLGEPQVYSNCMERNGCQWKKYLADGR